MHPKTDPELIGLIKKAKRGDENAINQIILKTQDRLYRFCLHLCGNSDLASEIAQETYLRVFSKLDQVTDPSGIFMWLFRIAKNIFIDETRKSSHKVAKSSDREDDENNLLGSLEGAPGDVETLVAVQDALLKMPEDQRTVLLLVDREEYSYAEAAEIFGVTEKAIKSRISKARDAFLKIYKKEGPK